MRNNNHNVMGTLTLLSSLFVFNAQADVVVIGDNSDISQSIADSYHQPITFDDSQLGHSDLLYVNVGTANDSDLERAKKHVVNGSTVILDLTSIASDDIRFNTSQRITGLGMAAPVVVTGTYDGEALVNAIVSDVTDENGNPINNQDAELASINQSLKHALNRFGFGGKQ